MRFVTLLFPLLAFAMGCFAQTDIPTLEKQFEQYTKANNNSNLASVANQLGYAYWNKGNASKAMEYFKAALPPNQAIGNKNGEAIALSSIGAILSEQNKHQEAREYLQKALDLRTSMGDRKGLAQEHLNIGVTYFDQKRYGDAINSLEKAVNTGQEANAFYVVTDAYDYLAKSHEALGNTAEALEYQRKFMEGFQVEGEEFISDLERDKDKLSATTLVQQLEIEKRDEEVEKLRLQRELAQREEEARKKEIENLKKEKQLKEEELKRKEAEIKVARLEQRNSRIIIAALGSGVVMLLIIALILRRANEQKQKANIELKRRQKIIEEQNEQLRLQTEQIKSLQDKQKENRDE